MQAQSQPQRQPRGLLSMSTQGTPEPRQERRGGLFGFMDPDRKDMLAMALMGQSMHPNEGLMRALGARIEGRREERKETARTNRTVEAIRGLVGDGLLPEAAIALAEADPSSAMRMAQTAVTAKNDPNVQSSAMLPDMSGTVMTMRDGTLRVLTVGGETLTGQAADDFVRQSQDTYTENQRSIYRARTEGEHEGDINLGGDAARTTEEGKMAPQTAKEFGEAASTVRSTIVNIDNAIRAIDEGANSGAVYNMLPKFDVASASLENSMNRLGLDVIGSVTFGALSAAEMRIAMETAAPQNLSPPELREWLTRRREAQAKAYQSLLEAAQHFASGGTQAEYYEMIGAQGVGQPPAPPQNGEAGGGTGAQPQRLRFNPETGEFE